MGILKESNCRGFRLIAVLLFVLIHQPILAKDYDGPYEEEPRRAESWQEWMEDHASTSYFEAQNKSREKEHQITEAHLNDALDNNPSYRPAGPLYYEPTNPDDRAETYFDIGDFRDTLQAVASKGAPIANEARNKAIVEQMKFLIRSLLQDELLIINVGSLHAFDFFLETHMDPNFSDVLYFMDPAKKGFEQINYFEYLEFASRGIKNTSLEALNNISIIDALKYSGLFEAIDMARMRMLNQARPIRINKLLEENNNVNPRVLVFGDWHGSRNARPGDFLPPVEVIKASGLNKIIYANEPTILGQSLTAPNGMMITGGDNKLYPKLGFRTPRGIDDDHYLTPDTSGLFRYDESTISFGEMLQEYRDGGLKVEVSGIESILAPGSARKYELLPISPYFQRNPSLEATITKALDERSYSEPLDLDLVRKRRDDLKLSGRGIFANFGDAWRLVDKSNNGQTDNFSTDIVFQSISADDIDGIRFKTFRIHQLAADFRHLIQEGETFADLFHLSWNAQNKTIDGDLKVFVPLTGYSDPIEVDGTFELLLDDYKTRGHMGAFLRFNLDMPIYQNGKDTGKTKERVLTFTRHYSIRELNVMMDIMMKKVEHLGAPAQLRLAPEILGLNKINNMLESSPDPRNLRLFVLPVESARINDIVKHLWETLLQ